MRDTRGARVVLGLLLAVALVLITVDHRGGQKSPLESLHEFGAAVFTGAERVGTNLFRPVREFAAALAEAVPDAAADPLAAARTLVNLALQAGGRDNITVLVIPFAGRR